MALAQGGFGWTALAMVASLLVLWNGPILGWFAEQRVIDFATLVIPLRILSYLVNVAAVLVAGIWHVPTATAQGVGSLNIVAVSL
jgi:hypothetical protein